MITFYSESDFNLIDQNKLSKWVEFCIHQENKLLGEIAYIFCSDDYLLKINIKHLNHNTLTDIISFDYGVDNVVSGDIYISTDRVADNAKDLSATFRDELHRVMIHGVLHYCGHKDKTASDKKVMRSKEDYYLSLRTF